MTPSRIRHGWFVLLAGLVVSCLAPRSAAAFETGEWDALFETLPQSAGPAGTTTGVGSLEGELPGESAPLSWTSTGEDVMQFTADYIEYDRKAGRVIMRGGAYAVNGDMQLWAEALELDMAPGRLYASGKVRFVRPTDDLAGETLDYNYKLREGEMTKVETWRGPNRVVASHIALFPNKLVATDVFTTACDHDPPHYRIHARKGSLFPADKLVLENAALMWGERRIVGFSRYKASLKRGEEGKQRFYIRPGYSTSRGFTLDAGYDFYFSDHDFGRIIFSGTSDAGASGGVAFRYGHGKPSGGDLRLFHSVTKIENQGPLGSRFLDTTNSNGTWSHRQKLSNRTQLNTGTTFTRIQTPGAQPNDELNLSASLTHDLPDYALGLSINRRIDLDADLFTGDDTVPFLNTLPLFTFQKKTPISLPGDLKLRLDGSWGRYAERATQGASRDVTKGEINMNLSGPGLTYGESSRLDWNLQTRKNWYSGGLDRDFFALTLNGQTTLSREFEIAYNYTLQRETGDTPFTFDLLQDQHIGSVFVRQRKGLRFNATWFEAFQDLDRGEFRSAASNFFWHSPVGVRTAWSAGLNFNYDFTGEKKLSDLRLNSISTNVRVGRERWRHQAVLNWDQRQSRLGGFSLASDFKLDEKWRVQLATNYGRGALGDLERTRLALALTRDLHAWEARLRWDVEQKEIFLEFYLKHQSKKPLGLRADFDTGAGAGMDFDPFVGEKLTRPGPQLRDIPAP